MLAHECKVLKYTWQLGRVKAHMEEDFQALAWVCHKQRCLWKRLEVFHVAVSRSSSVAQHQWVVCYAVPLLLSVVCMAAAGMSVPAVCLSVWSVLGSATFPQCQHWLPREMITKKKGHAPGELQPLQVYYSAWNMPLSKHTLLNADCWIDGKKRL